MPVGESLRAETIKQKTSFKMRWIFPFTLSLYPEHKVRNWQERHRQRIASRLATYSFESWNHIWLSELHS